MRRAPGIVFTLLLGGLQLGAVSAAAGEGEPRESGITYAVLRRALELQRHGGPASLSEALPARELTDAETLPVPFEAAAGSLVALRGTPPRQRMALADGRHLALRREPVPDDYEVVGIAEARERFWAGSEGLGYLALVDPTERESAYVATLLPGDRLLDCSRLGDDFNFLAQLLFVPGLELHLYQDGRPIGVATIAGPHSPAAFGLPGFDVAAIVADAPYDAGRPLIASLRPLPVDGRAETPEWTELLERPKRPGPGESHYDYEPIGPLDLDGDGVNELLFRDYGLESIGYSIFRYLDGGWRMVYRGGLYGY